MDLNSIWDVSEYIRKYLKEQNFVKDFHIKTKEHDSLYSFYDDYIEVKIAIDESKYIAEKLVTGLDLEQQIKSMTNKYKIYFEIIKG